MALYYDVKKNVDCMKNLNAIPRVRDIWLHINMTFLGGFAKFFKLEHRDRLQEGNRIIRVEFFECEAYVLSYKLQRNGEGVLVWVYASSHDICFNKKIDNNRMMAIRIKEKLTKNDIEVE
jgi:hypothetical protein